MSTIRANSIQGLDAANPAIELPANGTLVVASGFGGTGVSFPVGASGTPSIACSTDTNTGIYFPAADTIGFVEGGNEAVRIDSSSRLLVGTTTSTGFVPPGESFTTSASQQLSGSSITGASAYQATDTLNGDVGIGGSVFLNKRSSNDNGVGNGHTIGSVFFNGWDTSSLKTGAVIRAKSDGQTWASGDCPTRLEFSTTADGASSPTERMRIGSTGEVWINRTTRDAAVGADCKFQVLCTGAEWATVIRNSNASPYGLRITTDTDANNTSNAFLDCQGAGNQRATIRSNGGLANYSANNANLSDRNAKKDISPATGTWDCIKEWEIVNYRYKDQPDDADLNLGVIAQQVAESCPEVITVFSEATEDQPEKLGVKEQQMYWMAIKALQEAQVRIETLEAEVAALKAP